MEAELEKYRQKKVADERWANMKENVQTTWSKVTTKVSSALLPEETDDDDRGSEESAGSSSSQTDKLIKKSRKSWKEEEEDESEPPGLLGKLNKRTRMILLALKFIAWTLCYIGFIKIGFGAVFFAVSALYFIYANTSVRKKKKGEVSAYSVFNENCEAINGTLKAEHLEKQLLYSGL